MSMSPSWSREPSTEGRADELRTTLENCDDEPIRVPGSIQRHGFLLLLDMEVERVVAASENAAEYLGVPFRLILGTQIENVLERELLAIVKALDTGGAGQLVYLGAFHLRKELYSVVTHVVDQQRVLEFERLDRLVSPELMNAVITNFVGALTKLRNETELCSAIARQVKDLTGFNRVLLYSFDDAGHGTVLTEENDGALPSYLDLRFPAGDIPKQARELYVLNTVRMIPNAVYIPSPLEGLPGRTMNSFDLSFSVLRSVSPIHLEYMQNMGTMASVSISIVVEGRLWGLISCHHAEPRTVPFVVRSACDLLTKMVGNQLLAFRIATRLDRAVHFHEVQRRLLTHMAAEKNYVLAIIERMDELRQVTNASGTALVFDGACVLGGKTPDEADVLRLSKWMDSRPEMDVFESSHLQSDIRWAAEFVAVASGLLAIRISDVRQAYLFWFRPELVSTVTWAGEQVKVRDQERGLHPRASFESWQELVHGRSASWTDMEVASAQEFRSAVMTIGLRRAEEAVEVSEARFQQLTHALPNLIWAADDAGQLTYANRRWREEGLGAEGLWYEQTSISIEDQQRCAQLWRESVSEGVPFEFELRLKAGSVPQEHWKLARAVPFRRANGTRAGWVGSFTDLTKRHESELAIRMTEKLALTGRMTSVIAHEINNPLEALMNIHYLLEQEVRGNDPALAYLAMAGSELERISGITKQTLRWSKESSQQAESAVAGDLMDDVLRLFAGRIRNREVNVTSNGQETPIYGVIGQLRQVLANLLSNAIDASPVGGHVWLLATAGDGGTEIVVEDYGSGMSEETQRNLFQPFFSTKGDLGNGLGLYISQEIMERHGGKLLVVSAAGQGTRITMVVPPLRPKGVLCV